MKKLISIVILISFIALGCGNLKKNETSTKDEDKELIKEIKTLDSDAIKLEDAQKDIEKISAELDELLKEL